MHLEIFNRQQKAVLPYFCFTKDLKIYLAGGTALALQIGHRTSVDFDFYTQRHFKKDTLLKFLKSCSQNFILRVLRDIDDTFEIQLNNIHISCFYYPYSLLGNLIKTDYVNVVSIKDIAAMKLVAISQRGKRRDFIDMYYLIKNLELPNIFSLTEKKYPEFDLYNGLRGLVYFVDADNDKEVSRVKTFEDVNWSKVKKFIIQRVREYQKLKVETRN